MKKSVQSIRNSDMASKSTSLPRSDPMDIVFGYVVAFAVGVLTNLVRWVLQRGYRRTGASELLGKYKVGLLHEIFKCLRI